jgi:hypothetical protein
VDGLDLSGFFSQLGSTALQLGGQYGRNWLEAERRDDALDYELRRIQAVRQLGGTQSAAPISTTTMLLVGAVIVGVVLIAKG